MLVLIGATPEGKKELVGFQTGVRESAQSWRELLIDIKQRGLEIAPDLAVGEPALAKSGGRAWLLEGHRGGLSGRPAPAVLGSQDRQRAEQSCPLGSGMLGGSGDRIAENAVLNMARRDIAPGWRDGGGPALSVDRAGNVA